MRNCRTLVRSHLRCIQTLQILRKEPYIPASLPLCSTYRSFGTSWFGSKDEKDKPLNGIQRLRAAFDSQQITFVAYTTVGFPTMKDSLDVVKQLQHGGAKVIELGVPFTDPLADGPAIQHANQVALKNGVTSLEHVLDFVKLARKEGVTVPMVLMGYYNPFLSYLDGKLEMIIKCKEAGVDGFIIVDLPPEESYSFRQLCRIQGLSFIPLISPTTSPARIRELIQAADSFIYAVSLLGVTGERSGVNKELPEFLKKIQSQTNLPIAVGFGISNGQQFREVGQLANGVVVGSAIIRAAEQGYPGEAVRKLCYELTVHAEDGRSATLRKPPDIHDVVRDMIRLVFVSRKAHQAEKAKEEAAFGKGGKAAIGFNFGAYGGRYVPETLVGALDELDQEYQKCLKDPSFQKEVRSYDIYIGRPSRLHKAERISEYAGGAGIYLKREDLNHTGSHKINNAIAQALLAKRLGKTRIIAETGAGQHGVATATICAKLGLPLCVYMGSDDVERQSLNVFRMKLLGATVVPVTSGSRTLKDAINEAMRDWVTNIRTTHYLVGSAIGPHPFPTIVRDFQSVIGEETKRQMLELTGRLPDAVVACVGGGSNAIGMFHPFLNEKTVRLIGVEAGGEGVKSGKHSATLGAGTPGVLHGTRTYLLQDKHGQILETHSISAGLDYPGVGPEHAFFKDSGRAEYVSATDAEALEGMQKLTQLEGIIPALETAHAVFYGIQLAKSLPKTKNIVINLSGRGDKDMDTVRKVLPQYNLESLKDKK